ncbi:hypothetical protein [Paraflavitalea speifideaquila]|uniref:beta-xylosidase family glycoside hydrolase n=1 Tax=Paraflavitalea speifideaquila TaxID=3076558 RepID=UPI00331300D0
MGQSYANIALKSKKDGIWLVAGTCRDAQKGNPEIEKVITKLGDSTATVYIRLQVRAGAHYRFAYSLDGNTYTTIEADFQAVPGRWIGAKTGLFCTRTTQINDAGFVDIDWFRVDKLE